MNLDSVFFLTEALSEINLTNGLTVLSAYFIQMSDASNTMVPSSLRSIVIPSTIISIGKSVIIQSTYR